ncbi:metal-dependent hydrolase [Candidatus Woesearchaeota archaeon]|nr:metal-dependent hydrolase [Candidatus Woesearchaeota archaeon]
MEPLIHFIIPIIFLLAFAPNLNKKLIFLLSPLLILPDIDFFLKAKIFHNLLFVLVICFVVHFLYSWFIKKDKRIFYLALFYLSSHLLFDLGGPGIPFFYPISDKLFSLNIMIATSPAAKIGTITQTTTSFATKTLAEASIDQIAPIVTTPGVLFLLLAISIIITLIMIKIYKNK